MGVKERSTSVAHCLASVALQLVREDPALMERFRVLAAKLEVPFAVTDVTPLALELAEIGINETAMLLLSGALTERQRIERERERDPSVLNIPLPLDGDNGARSATALAIGSFTVEHVRTDPERLAALDAWMQETHPDTGWESGDFTDERMEDADQVLTIMAHVTSVAQDSGVLDHIRQRREQAEPHVHDETCGGYRDDGTRHV